MTASTPRPFFEKPADFTFFFAETPPRVSAEAKDHMNTIAETLVLETIRRMKAAGIPKLLPRHVPLILTSMCPEPHTYICKDTAEALDEDFQKQVGFVFSEQCSITLDHVNNAQESHRVPALQQNRRFYRRTRERFLHEFSQDASAFQEKAIILLAECVSKLCSIVIARSSRYMQKNTLTVEAFREATLQKHRSTAEASMQNDVADSALNRFLAKLNASRTVGIRTGEPMARSRVGIPTK